MTKSRLANAHQSNKPIVPIFQTETLDGKIDIQLITSYEEKEKHG